jgi:hypothetical protein
MLIVGAFPTMGSKKQTAQHVMISNQQIAQLLVFSLSLTSLHVCMESVSCECWPLYEITMLSMKSNCFLHKSSMRMEVEGKRFMCMGFSVCVLYLTMKRD